MNLWNSYIQSIRLILHPKSPYSRRYTETSNALLGALHIVTIRSVIKYIHSGALFVMKAQPQ